MQGDYRGECRGGWLGPAAGALTPNWGQVTRGGTGTHAGLSLVSPAQCRPLIGPDPMYIVSPRERVGVSIDGDMTGM